MMDVYELNKALLTNGSFVGFMVFMTVLACLFWTAYGIYIMWQERGTWENPHVRKDLTYGILFTGLTMMAIAIVLIINLSTEIRP